MRRYAVAAGVAVLVVLMAVGPVAKAAFPGQNGKIAYTYEYMDPEGDVHRSVAIANLDGTAAGIIASAEQPAWSPTGTKLAFTRRDPWTGDDVWIADEDGIGLTPLPAEPDSSESMPTWAPDGARLALTADVDFLVSETEVYKINVDGTGRTRLTDTPGEDRSISPAWSPDGRKIAFVRAFRAMDPFPRFLGTDIYTMSPDGTDVMNLTNTPSGSDEHRPDWSPDGRKLAFEQDFAVFVMNTDGTGRMRLADGCCPVWSPDGQKIAFRRSFLRDFDVHSEIVTMNADGSGASVVVSATNPYSVSEPDWQPLPVPAPQRSDYKNAAKFCDAERAYVGSMAFAEKYGTSTSRANAHGKCVNANK